MEPIHSIAGIILAAGASERMGSPKALLKCGDGTTLLSKQFGLLKRAGCSIIHIVVGADADEIRSAHGDIDADWVTNDRWQLGQFSSIQAGLAAAQRGNCEGAIVLPVDVPGVKETTINALMETALFNTHLLAIIPEYNEHQGHPIYLSKSFFQRLTEADPKDSRLDQILDGMKALMHLPVNDPHVVVNVNTPDEWEIYRKGA